MRDRRSDLTRELFDTRKGSQHMSLLDSISQWIDKDRAQLAYVRIPADHVDKPSTNQALKAGVHYIRLRLASMFLKKTTRWFSRWYPVVYSTVELEFGDRFIQIPNIADESRLSMDQTPDGDVFAQNF